MTGYPPKTHHKKAIERDLPGGSAKVSAKGFAKRFEVCKAFDKGFAKRFPKGFAKMFEICQGLCQFVFSFVFVICPDV